MSSIFPFVPGLQEQIDSINNSPTEVKLGRCFLFDFQENRFVTNDGKLVEIKDDSKKIKQWIRLILKTYKDKFNVYKGTDFYCNIDDLVGKNYHDGFVMSEISREITESLLTNRYISKVDNFSFNQEEKSTIISFDVTLVDGSIIAFKEGA